MAYLCLNVCLYVTYLCLNFCVYLAYPCTSDGAPVARSDVYLHVADSGQQIVPTDEVLRAFDLHYDQLRRDHGALKLLKVQVSSGPGGADCSKYSVGGEMCLEGSRDAALRLMEEGA